MKVAVQYRGFCNPKIYTEDQLAPNGDPLPGAVPRTNGPACNLLLERFYTVFLSGVGDGGTTNPTRASLLSYVQASPETTDPAPGDTSVTPLGTGRLPLYTPACTASISGNKIIQTLQYRGTKGQVQGTVGKFALFQNSTGGTPNAASRVKDSGGSPTTLPLGPNDYCYVDWIFETTVNLTPVTGVVTIEDEGDYNFELKPAAWNDIASYASQNPLACYSSAGGRVSALGFNLVRAYSTQTLGAVTATPSSSFLDVVAGTPASYVAGSRELDIEYYATEADLNVAGGIGAIGIWSSGGVRGGWQMSFAKTTDGSKLNKINTKEFRPVITYAFT